MESELRSAVDRYPFRAFVIHLDDGRKHVVFNPNVVLFGSWIEGTSGVMIDLGETASAGKRSYEFIEFRSIMCIAPKCLYSPKWRPALN